MGSFSAFLQLGFEHIADVRGYDHMLFIITLCAVYSPREWKKVLVLVTAFTIGHSVTLALSALDVVRLPGPLVETLIPVTILLTAIHNVIWHRKSGSTWGAADRVHYMFALAFGFIHGMGFSNYFRALMGDSTQIAMPLLAFNIGLELGQILIVIVFFATYWVLDRIFGIDTEKWTLFISGAGAGVALIMILEAATQG